jgi:predicted RNA methylase
MTASELVCALRSGQPVADYAFDDLYPLWARRASSVHWTPVAIALRAATLLGDKPRARLLDIGSGVGKFCIIAAAAVGARVRGVEQRTHLVEIAEHAAQRVGVDVTFTAGTLADCDPRKIDGVYLYNPFAENLCSFTDQIDKSVELSEARYARDVEATEAFLDAARKGTKVVTYCGFGGRMPPEYALVLRERYGGTLELWEKIEAHRRRVAPRESETRLRTSSGP